MSTVYPRVDLRVMMGGRNVGLLLCIYEMFAAMIGSTVDNTHWSACTKVREVGMLGCPFACPPPSCHIWKQTTPCTINYDICKIKV